VELLPRFRSVLLPDTGWKRSLLPLFVSFVLWVSLSLRVRSVRLRTPLLVEPLLVDDPLWVEPEFGSPPLRRTISLTCRP